LGFKSPWLHLTEEIKEKSPKVFERVFLCNNPHSSPSQSEEAKAKYSNKRREEISCPDDLEKT